MSDGPHRSLNQPSHWKKLAKSAEQAASTLQEISDRREEAILREMDTSGVRGVLGCFAEFVGTPQRDMFTTLEDVFSKSRDLAGGSEPARLVVDHVERLAGQSAPLDECIVKGVEAAIRQLDANFGRSAEEHCVREVERRPRDLPSDLPQKFRDRLCQSRELTDFRRIAESVASGERPNRSPRQLKTGIEEGPPLP